MEFLKGDKRMKNVLQHTLMGAAALCAVTAFAGEETEVPATACTFNGFPQSEATYCEIGFFPYYRNTAVKAFQFEVLIAESKSLSGFSYASCFTTTDIGEGMQLACAANANDFAGLQFGVAGNLATEFTGMQLGATNWTVSGSGLQLGAFNIADDCSVQIGALNILGSEAVDSGSGIQIGAINYNPNGFLPIFPLFNFTVSAE